MTSWVDIQKKYDEVDSWRITSIYFNIKISHIKKGIKEGLLNSKTKIIRECDNCNKLLGRKQSRFCSGDCYQEHRYKTHTDERAIAGTAGHGALRNYLLRKAPICTECGIGENWQGKKLSLHMDHVNGDSDDNTLENVRLLCPNCHSQTPNFGSKNKGQRSKRNLYMLNMRGSTGE